MIKVKVLHNQSPGDGDTLHNYTAIITITMYSSETVFVSAVSAKSEESQESPTVLTLTKVLQLATLIQFSNFDCVFIIIMPILTLFQLGVQSLTVNPPRIGKLVNNARIFIDNIC